MTARLSLTLRSAPAPRALGALVARLASAFQNARHRARERAELRQRLRTDARLRRDIGLRRFDLIRLSTED